MGEPFEQFETNPRTSTKGFGLGLHVVRELVHLNLGEVNVQSQQGRGCTFCFTIPSTDPGTLVGNYVKRLKGFRSSAEFVSLLAVRIDAVVTPAVTTELEQFLQRQIRLTDLLLRSHPETWFLLAATGDDGVHPMLRRLRRALREAREARAALPEIRWHVEGTRSRCERSVHEIVSRVGVTWPGTAPSASRPAPIRNASS